MHAKLMVSARTSQTHVNLSLCACCAPQVLLTVAAPLYVGILISAFWLLRLGYLLHIRPHVYCCWGLFGRSEKDEVASPGVRRGGGGGDSSSNSASTPAGKGSPGLRIKRGAAVAAAPEPQPEPESEAEAEAWQGGAEGRGEAGAPWEEERWQACMSEPPGYYLRKRLTFTIYSVLFYF